MKVLQFPADRSAPIRRGPRLPSFRPFQLATLSDAIPKGNEWLFEMKFDGYRAQVALAGKEIRVFTRNGHDWTSQFAAIVPALGSITGGSALIDGEICALNEKGQTDFSRLKIGIGAGAPLKFFAFDLLELDGRDLQILPLVERKALLEALLGKRASDNEIQFSGHVLANGKDMFDAMCAGGHEGILAKKANGRYLSDRTTDWLKIKCIKRQEFVVGGWRPSDTGSGMASLILGTYEDGELVYRGRVGTGFTDRLRSQILQQLKQLSIDKPPFGSIPRDIARRGRWVRPELVAEVAFTEITSDGSLRHPSFMGLREDKSALEVRVETPASGGGGLDPALGAQIADAVGVKLTNPSKVVYPETQITKAHLAAYYASVAERMLPHIIDRPLSLVRCTDESLAKCFFQKHELPGMPVALHPGALTKLSGKDARILYVEDVAGLIAGVQMNTLEFHVWGSRRQKPHIPERIVFDIDPDEGLDFEHVKQAAFDIRDVLGALELTSFPLLSGGKGIHVVVPLTPRADWDVIKQFCQSFAEMLAAAEPDRFVANMSKARRKGRMFLDYLRNAEGSTAITPWSTRARDGGPVAAPITWEELPTIDRASRFDIFAAAERAQKPDPWAGYFQVRQSITARIMKAVRR